MALEHTLQRFSMNAEGFGSPTEIVIVHCLRAHSIVSLEILERLQPATCVPPDAATELTGWGRSSSSGRQPLIR
jgi:hypothetical protein